MISPMHRRLRLLCALLALGLVASACSGRKGSSGGAKRATGKPLPVGMINMEDSPTGSFPELRRDAEAAVRYVNEELGGVHNHPLQLEVCRTQGTPESSQACANQLRAKNPVAVLGGIDLGASASLPVLERAKIPYISLTPALGDELASPDSFTLAGGLAADLLGQAEYITGTLQAKKVGVLHLDLPGLQEAAVFAARTVLQKRGVSDLKIVSEKADAADFIPAVRSATASNPEVLIAVFPAQGCTRVLQATQALRVRARLFLPSACGAQEVFDAGGAAAEGVTFASPLLPYTATDNPEVATYREKLRRYAGDTSPSLLSQAGFSLVMDLQRLLNELDEGSLKAEMLTEKVKAARDEPSFMGHPYTCNGREVPLLPSVCSAAVRLLQYRGGNQFQDVTGDWVSGAKLLELLTG
jgi:branched-chain amino acid transport system substrate-binding protein